MKIINISTNVWVMYFKYSYKSSAIWAQGMSNVIWITLLKIFCISCNNHKNDGMWTEVIDWICIYTLNRDRFPFYKSNDDRWKNSVRHNLSINPHFRKGNKAPQGAGHLWIISTRDSEANLLAWEHVNKLLFSIFDIFSCCSFHFSKRIAFLVCFFPSNIEKAKTGAVLQNGKDFESNWRNK